MPIGLTPTDPQLASGAAGVSPPPARLSPDQPAEPRRRPWGWIAVCAVLALAVVGVTIWALNAQSDLDHQRDQTAAAQQQAEHAAAEADQLSSQMDQLTQDVNDAVDQAGQAGAAAKDQLQGALSDLKGRLGELAGQVKPPAQGSGGSPAPTATPAIAAENATPGGP